MREWWRTVNFLFVDFFDVVRVRGGGVSVGVERIGTGGGGGDEAVEEASAAIGAWLGGVGLTPRRQIRGVEDGRVRVVLVWIHLSKRGESWM